MKTKAAVCCEAGKEFVGVADAGSLDLDQHLAELRAGQINRLDHQRIARFVANGSLGLHADAPSMTIVRASLEQAERGRHLRRCARRKDVRTLPVTFANSFLASLYCTTRRRQRSAVVGRSSMFPTPWPAV